jgi:ribosome-associated protein
MSTDTGDTEQLKSKTRLKKEMAELQRLGERLLDLPQEQLEKLSDQALKEAVLVAKKIKKNSAKKRQLQFIGKLMRNTNLDEITKILDQFDNRSRQSAQHFHKLERWRTGLIANDNQVMQEILVEYPHTDRQHLRHLIRHARDESISHPGGGEYSRKLFRYLRALVEDPATEV